jgi:hypothetical protein
LYLPQDILGGQLNDQEVAFITPKNEKCIFMVKWGNEPGLTILVTN